MSKVITVTLNTSIDHFLEVGSFEVGQVFKSTMSSLFPSGKGINVARTIEALGHNVTAIGFVGSLSKSFFTQIESSLLHTKLTTVPGSTRTNVTIFDPEKDTTTHIRNSGFIISNENLEEFEKTLEQVIEEHDVVVVSGSLPVGIPSIAYRRVIDMCHKFRALVILDSSNEPLQNSLSSKPYMIKPNLEELQTLAGKKLHNVENEVVAVAREIAYGQGIPLVVVSRGEKGILVIEKENHKVWKAYLPIDKQFIKTMAVGSGDALVGGFAIGLKKNLPMQEIIRLGVACGVSNLLSSEPGSVLKSDVGKFFSQVCVEQIIV
jgi:1-phosphofructokinase family hexose kinase